MDIEETNPSPVKTDEKTNTFMQMLDFAKEKKTPKVTILFIQKTKVSPPGSSNFFSTQNKQKLVMEGEEVKLISEENSSKNSSFSLASKREQGKMVIKWDDNELSQFYKGLEIFGTDFSMLKELIPTKSRKQIKLKFRKEEKTNLRKIEEALSKNSSFKDSEAIENMKSKFESGKSILNFPTKPISKLKSPVISTNHPN